MNTGRVRTGNAALNLNILRKMALYRLKKVVMEKKRVSAKRRMMSPPSARPT